MSIKNVILIGAGGNLGPTILKALLDEPSFSTSILARSSSTSTFPPNVPVHRVADDYPEADLLKAFEGQDAIVSTIATASAKKQNDIVDAAIKAGVKRFVPSEFGSDTNNAKAMEILPQYFAGKRAAVDYLKSKESEISWSAFVTGPFFELAMSGFMGFNIPSSKAFIYGKGEGTWSTTTMPSIGLAVANALKKPEATKNRYVFVDSFTVSQNEVLHTLEKLQGKKWEVDYVDAEEQKKIGQDKLANGDFSGAMALIRYINSVDGHGGNYATYQKTDNELLGLPKQTLEEVLKKDVLKQ